MTLCRPIGLHFPTPVTNRSSSAHGNGNGLRFSGRYEALYAFALGGVSALIRHPKSVLANLARRRVPISADNPGEPALGEGATAICG